MTVPDDEVPPHLFAYPPADITPTEFEGWVGELFEAAAATVDDLRVEVQDRIEGTDGAYTFDATVRYQWHGLDFLVLVEAKRHVNPIKRELVQVLHSKAQSVGAHKAVMISTAPYQSGALEFAKAHGIALVTVTESRFTYETRSILEVEAPSREQASGLWGMPTFAGHHYGPGDTDGSTSITLVSTEFNDYIPELLLGIDAP